MLVATTADREDNSASTVPTIKEESSQTGEGEEANNHVISDCTKGSNPVSEESDNLIELSPAHIPKHRDDMRKITDSRTKEELLDATNMSRQRSLSECSTSTTAKSLQAHHSKMLSENMSMDDVDIGDRVCKDGEEDGQTCVTSSAAGDGIDGKGDATESKNIVHLEPITVPYLSPLVLRKEVENVLEQEGDQCLSRQTFLDEHPIIYWNLVWYFKRLDTPSHISGFILTASTTNKHMAHPPKSWCSADSRHINIRPVWDNPRLHIGMGLSMYMMWNNSAIESSTASALVNDSPSMPRSAMQQIVSSIMTNDVITPMKMMLNERRKHKNAKAFRSIYREILFLSFMSLGRENIDHDAFDREFKLSFSQLPHRDRTRMRVYDKPPNMAVIWSRKLFSDLELCS